MNAYEVVDRPEEKRLRNGPTPSLKSCAVAETATTGRAIRIALNGKRAGQWRSRLHSYGRLHHLRVHVVKDGPDHLLCWAEKKA